MKVVVDFLLKNPELIGVLLVAISICIGIRENTKARFIQVFAQYTQRYSQIMDGLPEKARHVHLLKELDLPQQEISCRVFRNYLNLCSEEMFLADTGYIDQKAWKIWKQGIRATLADIHISAEIWEKLQTEYRAFPKFQTLINSSLSSLTQTPQQGEKSAGEA